jgi:hypothetical protein
MSITVDMFKKIKNMYNEKNHRMEPREKEISPRKEDSSYCSLPSWDEGPTSKEPQTNDLILGCYGSPPF